jgi:hypothetical protein
MATVTAVALASATSSPVNDLWHLSDYEHELAMAEAQSSELESNLSDSHLRVFQKEQILVSLISGKLSFAQAANQFCELNRGTEMMDFLHICYPIADDRELASRNLLMLADGSIPAHDTRSRAQLNRWVNEFRQTFPHAAPLSN